MSKSTWSLLWAASIVCASAQQPAPLTPKTQPAPLPQTPATLPEPALTEQLKGMVIVGAENEIKELAEMSEVTGIQVLGPAFLVQHKSDLEREFASFLGQRLTQSTLKLLQTNLIRFSRRYESRILDVVYLDQRSIRNGVLQMAVVEGRTVIDPERDRVPELRGVLLVGSPSDIKATGGVGPISGVKIIGPRDLLGQEAGLQAALKGFLGQPFSAAQIDGLRGAIQGFAEKIEDVEVAAVIVPEQEIVKGENVVQVLVAVGEVGRLNIENRDKKWFSDARIREMVRIRQGDPVIVDRLIDDINWINRNMFREADVRLRQGAEIGQVDVNVLVNDRLPLQGFAGVEDTLPETLDRYMWFAGINWGKAFGLDHLLNYQFAAGFDFNAINSHSASYIAPLPWRHILTLGGAYAEFNPDLSGIGPLLNSDGTAYQFNGLYSVPLPRIKSYFSEISVGFDYKYTDNNLLFGGGPLLRPTEIAQIVGAYEGLILDRFGRSRVQVRGVYSPGDLFDNNSDEAFNLTHTGAEADYYYLKFAAERVTKLPFLSDWRQRDVSQCISLALSGAAQLSETRLLPSEQIVFGGYDSVRGYDEFSVLADEGWKARVELRSPEFVFGRSGPAEGAAEISAQPDPKRAIRIQVLGFFDYGKPQNFLQSSSEFDAPDQDLMSVGAGLRGGWSRYLDFRFDWGFQVGDEIPDGQNEQRAHFSVVAKF